MLKGTIKSLTVAAILATGAISAQAADFTIRATANSNENDEDYDGLIVFKNYVESHRLHLEDIQHLLSKAVCQ